jgi:hypothetical protein
MRVIRIVASCGLASLALCGLGTASAAASTYPLTGLPELGRCVKVTLGTGHFNRNNCVGTDKDGNDGEYEWEPGPGASAGFEGVISSIIFRRPTGGAIGCTVGLINGEYANGKELKVKTVELQGCHRTQNQKPCYTEPLKQGTIFSETALKGTIGFIPNPNNPSAPWVGFDLAPESELSEVVLSFFCGEGVGTNAEKVEFKGSVIGRIKTLNKMIKENGIQYKQAAGVQNPEKFITGEKDTLTEEYSSFPFITTGKEPIGLETIGYFKNAELMEVKAKQR